MNQYITGNLVDIHSQEIYTAKVYIKDGVIDKIEKVGNNDNQEHGYIMPGFVDAHNHIESSMLNPAEFGRNALKQGTLAAICDPHEIANVCGEEGINYMFKCAEQTPMKISFGLPSCVPAVDFEVSGSKIDAEATTRLINSGKFIALSEMMNVPGVIFEDSEVRAKIEAAKSAGKKTDGHCPALSGENLKKYIAAGISTDHEVETLEEAEEKIALGMKIQIREGSSAKSFDRLMPLIESHPDMVMLCTDDYKSFDLKKAHINKLVSRAVESGYNLFNVLKAATLNAAMHYNLPLGLLREGDSADFIVVNNLNDFDVTAAYINGKEVSKLSYSPYLVEVNNFEALPVKTEDIPEADENHIIGVVRDSLYTKHLKKGETTSIINKIVCYNRYQRDSKPVSAYIEGFNITKGAMGSTIGHDSHNIIVVGYDDESITKVINTIVEIKGGVVVFDGEEIVSLPLPVGGLMSNNSIDETNDIFNNFTRCCENIGCNLTSPLMTLSFMSLPVIPSLKLTTKGLFDVDKFDFVK